MVRIEPKVPRPQISYDEWDGLLRVVFVRRNRTIQAGFNSTPVMNMIERNYKTWCAQNDIALGDGPLEDVGMEDVEEEVEEAVGGQMDVDDDDDMPSFFSSEARKEVKIKSKGKVGDLVRAKVKKVLDDTELGQQRAGKCDEADFLKYTHVTPATLLHLLILLPGVGCCTPSTKRAFISVEQPLHLSCSRILSISVSDILAHSKTRNRALWLIGGKLLEDFF